MYYIEICMRRISHKAHLIREQLSFEYKMRCITSRFTILPFDIWVRVSVCVYVCATMKWNVLFVRLCWLLDSWRRRQCCQMRFEFGFLHCAVPKSATLFCDRKNKFRFTWEHQPASFCSISIFLAQREEHGVADIWVDKSFWSHVSCSIAVATDKPSTVYSYSDSWNV